MKYYSLPFALLLLVPGLAHAEKVWTNSLSDFWSNGTNWTGHTPPDINSFIEITNDLTKTVTIDSSTAATNLTVQKLTLNAPPGATNTLLLSSVGTNNPLVFQTGLELQDGAALWLTNSAILLQLTNDHVNIDGTLTMDSGWFDFGDTTVTARVGRVTSGILTLNGGTVWAGAVTVGGLTNSSGAVYINGGTFNVSSFLSVGRNPGTTGSCYVASGQLLVQSDDTKVGDAGIGQMTISNATAWLTNLDIGHDALSAGTVWLENGGLLIMSNDISTALSVGSTGSLFVAGGTIAAAGQKIKIGRQGAGQITVSAGTVQADALLVAADLTNTATGMFSMSGGTMLLASNLTVGGVGNSIGQAVSSGGSILVTNAAGSAAVSVPNGNFTLSAGRLTTDMLLLTNSTGQFALQGGTVDTKSTSVANGQPFVVGDGVHTAELHLSGGTHFFANGLVISNNASLTGCGTIVGQISNYGLIATNCGVVLVQPTITRVGHTGSTVTVSFTSVVGQSYYLEYKNHLTDLSWTSVAGPAAGTGTNLSLSDTSATVPTRFYHVRTQ